MINKISIKRKIIFLIIAVFTLSIGIASVYIFISQKKSSKKLSLKLTKVINDNYINKINSELQKGMFILNSIENNLPLYENIEVKSVQKQVEFVMSNYISKNIEVEDFFLLLSPNKNIIKYNNFFISDSIKPYSLSYHKTAEGIAEKIFDETDFSFNLNTLKKKIFNFSEPFLSKHVGTTTRVVTISKPIIKNGKIIGVLGINYSLSGVEEVLNSVSTYHENAKLFLLTKNEDVIFISGKSWLSGKNINYSEISEQKIYNNIKESKLKNTITNDYASYTKYLQVKKSNLKWELVTIIPYDFFITELINGINLSIFIAIVIMLLGFLIVFYFINKTFVPIDEILAASHKIKNGEIVSIKQKNNNTELGKIVLNLNAISQKIKEASLTSLKIANGNYEISMPIKNDKDVLPIAINRIAKSLKETKEKSLSQDENTKRQLWMRRGRFEVAEAERKSSNNVNDLTFNILRKIVNYTGATLGGIYLYKEDKNVVELIAAYAYENKKQIDRKFKLGEGLIGSCVIEQKKILITDVPDDYVKIVSGLGAGKPTSVSIIPIFYQGKINSVIELAFIKKPEDYIIEFIERLGDNIGAWIDASLINTKTAELLQISQKQTEELAEKEYELNIRVEELQKVRAAIDIQNLEYKSMMNAVNHTVMTVEYNLEGVIINSNEKYEEIMGFSSYELEGINVFELVKDEKDELRNTMQEVSKGKIIKKIVKRHTKIGEERWFSATYTPYYNEEDEITRILFFAHDITKMKLELDRLKNKK